MDREKILAMVDLALLDIGSGRVLIPSAEIIDILLDIRKTLTEPCNGDKELVEAT